MFNNPCKKQADLNFKWRSIKKILATLVQHQKDSQLWSPYQQFKRFTYQTVFEESDKSTSQLPNVLTRKIWNLIIQLQAQHKMKKQYTWEIYRLWKTPCFDVFNKDLPEVTDKGFLHNIAEIAIKNALFNSGMVFSVRSSNSSWTSNLYVVAMKLVAILVILCHSAHRNNSNYILLLIVLYLYSAVVWVDIIMLLNNLGLWFYTTFFKKNSRILLLPVNIELDNKQKIDS